MGRKCNLCSFYLLIACLLITIYSLHTTFYQSWNNWMIETPSYVILLLLTVTAVVLAIIGFQDKTNYLAVMRSWFTLTVSLLLSTVLILTISFLVMFSPEKEHIRTTQSPDGNYVIDFYTRDGGATTTVGVIGELNGPLWYKKRFYIEEETDHVEVEWENPNIVSINNHTLNLENEETFRD